MSLTLLSSQPPARIAYNCSLSDEVLTVRTKVLELFISLVKIDGRDVGYRGFSVGSDKWRTASHPESLVKIIVICTN